MLSGGGGPIIFGPGSPGANGQWGDYAMNQEGRIVLAYYARFADS